MEVKTDGWMMNVIKFRNVLGMQPQILLTWGPIIVFGITQASHCSSRGDELSLLSQPAVLWDILE